ncbi:MAG: hypothetical protein QOE43_14 [Gaiellaceae bacterium]|nr:hypothetical protein [Gaiellaceae bacterium]
MRRPFPRLAAACAFAVAMTAFTGSAFAGNGNGNGTDSAPGQVKKDQPAATQAPAPATAQPQQQAATQPQSGQDPPGQAKKQQSTASASAQSSTQLGVKPASHTTKWTHCIVGQAAGVTTCTSSDNGHTPQPNVDASKKYGNGTTAAQIVVSRGGASANVQLTGPGNSQPHKVTLCGKPSNKSGGVDVHAVKDYSAAACSQTPAKAAAIVPQAPCGFVVAAATSETGKSHGHGKGLSHNKHETATTSFSVQPDSTQSCHSAAAVAPTTQLQAAVAPVTPAASPVMQSSSPAMQSSTAAPVTKRAAGGVLGVQTTLASPKPARGGVLGAATHLAGSSLPFTGFPIWLAVVLAVALILAGLALRRRGAPTRA